MKITLELPREAEARVRFCEKDGLVIVEPRFTRPDVSQSVAYLTVTGGGGAVRRYGVYVSGKLGRIRVEEVHDVACEFDAFNEVPVAAEKESEVVVEGKPDES